METLRELLHGECSYRMQEETMDRFLSLMSEFKLRKNEVLIPYGSRDSNVYVLRSGITRMAYFNGEQERTNAFGMPGTMTISHPSYSQRSPSFFKFEACCDSVMMKVTETDFLRLINESNDFAQWVLWMFDGQLWSYERKLLIVNGTARERFEAIAKNRPEIIKYVSSQHIASYIGITPQYLSKLKSEFARKSKK